MTEPVSDTNAAACGIAALSICESLILAMGDLKIMHEDDAVGVITDAATAHRNVGGSAENIALHAAAATILERILAGGNSIRRP